MRVLLVEDDAATAQAIELRRRDVAMNVHTTQLGQEAVDLAKLYTYDIVLLELNLPDISGFEVLTSLRRSRVMTPIMIVSGLAGIDEPELKISEVFICKLRKKLAANAGGANFVETIWGRGYVLLEPEADEEAIPA